MGQDATAQVTSELVLDMRGHPIAHGVGFLGLSQVGLEVFPDDTVQGRVLGPPTPVGLGRGAGWA